MMYNPDFIDGDTLNQFVVVLENMSNSSEGQEILQNILNTDSIQSADTESHLGIYGNLIQNVPGITSYYGQKYSISL